MDAFYASVEQRDNPLLRGKPVLVGGDGGRGVVSAASYEARKFGCRSAQPMSVAKRMCPAAIVVHGDMAKYSRISDEMFDILGDFSPLVEPISIDEAFVDLTGSERLLGEPVGVARIIKKRIKTELQLTASIGVAANKFIAKLASDLNKPDGLTVIGPEDVARVFPPLPVGKIWGIGPKTESKLKDLGIRTIGDILKLSHAELTERFGESGDHYFRMARGMDEREVTPDHAAKSIGHETTFGANLVHPDEVRAVLLELTEHVAARLRRHGRRALTVTVKIRFGDFKTITRAATLRAATDLTRDLWLSGKQIFDDWAARDFQPVRLIGISVSHLTEPTAQLDLFTHPTDQKQGKLDAAMDAINQKFGKDTVKRGGRIGKRSAPRPLSDRRPSENRPPND
jgi:DNA polymerase-4